MRKVNVPDPISRLIGSFALPREVVNRLLTMIHIDVPAKAEKFRHLRVNDQRVFRCPLILRHEEAIYRFDLFLDDTTSSDYYFVTDITYLVQ